MCDLFVSKCSARFYGAGKQWAVCTHYSSKHTPIHTSGNVHEHMDFTLCSAIITQTVKNKTQTTEERAEQMWACFPTVCDPYVANHLLTSVGTCYPQFIHLRGRNMVNRVQFVPKLWFEWPSERERERQNVCGGVCWGSISQAVQRLIHTGS